MTKHEILIENTTQFNLYETKNTRHNKNTKLKFET